MTPRRQRLVAIVPMRHDSERVVGKNYRTLGDRPLFAHVVGRLLVSRYVDEIVLDTDSPEIQRLARDLFQDEVTMVNRPAHLRSGATPMPEVLLHTIDVVGADVYLQTHSTNPFLRTATIDDAIERYEQQAEHDTLFGVTRLQSRLYDAKGTPINHDPARLERTQDLAPVYEENSNLYVFTGVVLRATGSRTGRSALMYEIPRLEAWDIDDEDDFTIAEHLWASEVVR